MSAPAKHHPTQLTFQRNHKFPLRFPILHRGSQGWDCAKPLTTFIPQQQAAPKLLGTSLSLCICCSHSLDHPSLLIMFGFSRSSSNISTNNHKTSVSLVSHHTKAMRSLRESWVSHRPSIANTWQMLPKCVDQLAE